VFVKGLAAEKNFLRAAGFLVFTASQTAKSGQGPGPKSLSAHVKIALSVSD
jgi:hypothetical protein